jgi:hypothetical protein
MAIVVYLYQQAGIIGYIKAGNPVTRAKGEQITYPVGKKPVFTKVFEGFGAGPLGNEYQFNLLPGLDVGTVRFSDMTGRTDELWNSQRDWSVENGTTITDLII